MLEYKRKPILVQAFHFSGYKDNYEAIEHWSQGRVYIRGVNLPLEDREMEMNINDETVRAKVGDFIIKDIQGNFYPVKPDIFHLLYEEPRLYNKIYKFPK